LCGAAHYHDDGKVRTVDVLGTAGMVLPCYSKPCASLDRTGNAGQRVAEILKVNPQRIWTSLITGLARQKQPMIRVDNQAGRR